MRFDDFPPHLVEAVIAIEDRRFFSHFGLDPRGLARAMAVNMQTGALGARRLDPDPAIGEKCFPDTGTQFQT